MIGGINSEYNTMVWKTYQNVNAMDINNRNYVGTNTGYVRFVGVGNSCALGSIFAGS